MTIGLIGKKIGMSREFIDSGLSIPVTILAVEKGRIINVFTDQEEVAYQFNKYAMVSAPVVDKNDIISSLKIMLQLYILSSLISIDTLNMGFCL